MRREDINPDAHWRDSARQVRFFIIDYRATFPLLLFIFFPSMTFFWIIVFLMGFLFFIERYGYTVTVFLRVLRGFIGGRQKSAIPWWRSPRVS